MQRIALALLASLLSNLAYAQSSASSKDHLEFAGPGAVGCGVFLAYPKPPIERDTVVMYVLGYINGYNEWGSYPKVENRPNAYTIRAYLEKHCRDNPLDLVGMGAAALIGDLGGAKFQRAK